MSESQKDRITIGFNILGWAGTLAGVLWLAAQVSAQVDINTETIKSMNRRITALEANRVELVEIRTDVRWIKAQMEKR